MTTEQVKQAIIALAGMTVAASITPAILAGILEKMRSLSDSEKQSLKEYTDDFVRELREEIAKKQALLTSGVNIKTLNGQSILGDGNITIKEATGKEATKIYVDELIAGITREIAKKQELLVSGINIRTINGQSILGDGNLTIQGGEGQGTVGTNDYTMLINKPSINGKLLIGDVTLELDGGKLDLDDFVLQPTEDGSLDLVYQNKRLVNFWIADDIDAGLMSSEDKRKLETLSQEVDKIDVEHLNEKVANAESAAISAAETLADIDESIKKLMESDPDATDDEVLKNTVAATALKVSKIGISSANDETDADLNIADRNGNIVMQLKNGHIKTKNFDSSNINNDNNSSADCSTKNGYIADIFLKYHAIGDSITAGQGTTEGNRYFEIIKPLCNFENVTSDAAGGLTLVESINYFLSRIPSDTELVSIFLGTNDYGHNIQLGTMDSSVGSDDFYGKLKYACEYMRTNKPDVKYFFICPISRVGEGNNNTTGHKLADYVNAIKEVCGIYNVPYIDLFSGKNAKSLATYTGDGLHPNAEGHKILAFQISKFINNKL